MSDFTLIVIIAIVIALHFIIGFVWVFRKIYGKAPDKAGATKVKQENQTDQLKNE